MHQHLHFHFHFHLSLKHTVLADHNDEVVPPECKASPEDLGTYEETFMLGASRANESEMTSVKNIKNPFSKAAGTLPIMERQNLGLNWQTHSEID
jgi:hypothetical protein